MGTINIEFFIYLIVVNFLGFFLMGLDKWKAKNKKWRVSEKTFFGVSLCGGSIGTWLGMYVFHHKTRHWYFVIGIPFILLLQAIIGYLLTSGR
ncbi:MAG: DUF1294 domain-containing protein [Lachnospiraceae bacterium]